MYTNIEDYGELLEDYETDESDEGLESDEAARGRRGKVPTAKRGNPVPQKVAQGFATKSELQATAQRLDARIATNSKAISSVDARARALEGEAIKLRAQVKHEIAERKLATDALKKSLDDVRQMSMLMPLLATQETQTVAGVPNVIVDSGDPMSKLLPILLMSGGMGGGSGSGGGGLFGGDGGGGIGTIALVMALAK